MKGYPVVVENILHALDDDQKGKPLRATIEGDAREMNYGEWFTKNYPPSKGDVVYKIVRRGREATNFVLKGELSDSTPENQHWEMERVVS